MGLVAQSRRLHRSFDTAVVVLGKGTDTSCRKVKIDPPDLLVVTGLNRLNLLPLFFSLLA